MIVRGNRLCIGTGSPVSAQTAHCFETTERRNLVTIVSAKHLHLLLELTPFRPNCIPFLFPIGQLQPTCNFLKSRLTYLVVANPTLAVRLPLDL